jgi:hypothetical protein
MRIPGQFNILALTASILTFVLIAASVFVPWWQLIVGNPAIATVNFSPVNFNFALFNTLLTVPIIWALNLACLLMLLAGGIGLLVYSIKPTKSYSKTVLGFGYKKPLYAFILFIFELLILYFSASMFTGASFPLVGSSAVVLPSALIPGGISISIDVSAAFGWTFYLSIVVVVLCLAVRVFHKRITDSLTATVNQTLLTPPTPPASS